MVESPASEAVKLSYEEEQDMIFADLADMSNIIILYILEFTDENKDVVDRSHELKRLVWLHNKNPHHVLQIMIE